jgi:hypothetical protein
MRWIGNGIVARTCPRKATVLAAVLRGKSLATGGFQKPIAESASMRFAAR